MAADNPGMFSRDHTGRVMVHLSMVVSILLTATAASAAADLDGAAGVPEGTIGTGTIGATPTRSAREQMLLEFVRAVGRSDEFLVIGEADTAFVTRFSRAQGVNPKGALLYVPARGSFVGSDAMTDALFHEFPGNGWSVLAVQAPLPERVADLSDYDVLADSGIRRIRDAVQYLVAEGTSRIAVVGNSSGATLVHQCLANGVPSAVAAFAGLGSWSGEIGERPTLELIGERDIAALGPSTRRKEQAARKAAAQYERVLLGGADARYLGFENEIARRIRGWLERIEPNAASPAVP